MKSFPTQLDPPNGSAQAPLVSTRTLHCEINETDIAEMTSLFDSGMADLTTSNAVVISLKRHLKPGCLVRTIHWKRERDWLVRIDDYSCRLPGSIAVWMTKFAQGWRVGPITFRIEIPGDLALPCETLPAPFSKEAKSTRRLRGPGEAQGRSRIFVRPGSVLLAGLRSPSGPTPDYRVVRGGHACTGQRENKRF
ncbi:MAG: hypothetical protein WD342_19515 [Verrucomicrobiales bacterium]